MLRKVLFWPDTHFPCHDSRSVQLILDFAAEWKPEEIIMLGDIFDVACVSSYDRDPRKDHRFLSDELALGISYLKQIDIAHKDSKIVFLEGNHEQRIKRYLFKGAPKIVDRINMKEILGVPDRWSYLPYGMHGHYRVGKNWVATHGTVFSKHFAHSLVTKWGCNVIQGHVHRMQEHFTTKFDGTVLKAMSCGWLGDPTQVDYINDFPDWQQGFAVGYFKKDGTGFVQNIPIINHQAVIEGRLYKK